jgi:glutamate--cysteine ligase
LNSANKIKNVILSNCVPENQRKLGVEIEGLYYTKHMKRLPVNKTNSFSAKELLDKIKLNSDAFSCSLEPGGQLEWASLPHVNLWEIQRQYDQHMIKEEALCKEHEINRLFLSVDPFFSPDEIELIDSLKYKLMHNEFIKKAELGPWMMRNTTSIQLNIDFTSEEDANEMAYIADSIQPLVSILFSNAPFIKNEPVGNTNMRWKIWSNTDPSRCGSLFEHNINSLESIVIDYANWIKDLQAIFIYDSSKNANSFSGTMEEMILSDDSLAELHILSALHQSFTNVRFKTVLEIRSSDCPPRGFELAPAAFMTGLLTDKKNRETLLTLVSEWSDLERKKLIQTANNLSFSNKGPSGKTIGDWLSLLSALCLKGLDRRETFYKIKNERPLLEALLNDILINGPLTIQLQKKYIKSGLPLNSFLLESSLDSKRKS